jgi:hypothetical protein
MYGPVLEKREWGLLSRTVPALPITAYYQNDWHGVDNETVTMKYQKNHGFQTRRKKDSAKT